MVRAERRTLFLVINRELLLKRTEQFPFYFFYTPYQKKALGINSARLTPAIRMAKYA